MLGSTVEDLLALILCWSLTERSNQLGPSIANMSPLTYGLAELRFRDLYC